MAVGTKTKKTSRRDPRVKELWVAYTDAPEGGFDVEVLGSVGAFTQGETLEEARANAIDVIKALLEDAPRQLSVRRFAIPPGALVERVLVLMPAR